MKLKMGCTANEIQDSFVNLILYTICKWIFNFVDLKYEYLIGCVSSGKDLKYRFLDYHSFMWVWL